MQDVFDLAPKVELHLHLEGAIPLDTLHGLLERSDGAVAPDIEDLRRRFVYRDFSHFIDTWWWMTGFISTTDDFTEVAEGVARSLADQHVVYAEASFSPTDFARHGLGPQQIATAIRTGLDRVPETAVVLNVDLVRDTGPERADVTLSQVLEVARECDIRGITIGGSESKYPPELFAAVYRRAAGAGMRLSAHAGEAAGPHSVWGAVSALGVERIGHGVRSVEDPELVRHLAAAGIPLEVCPSSNIRTGVASGWNDHPIHRLLEHGVTVTINSDDPTFFDCSLGGEFRSLSRFDVPPMQDFTMAAIDASWMTDVERGRLRHLVAAWWDDHAVN